VRLAPYVPQLDALRRARAFISHGGANSVMEAITRGVPLIISPICNDQHHNAILAERAGVGRTVNLERATVSEVATAIEQALAARPTAIHASYARDGARLAAMRILELA
jgi:UDP:flavonoid glycosyltransferase YjiC (YdhE family)